MPAAESTTSELTWKLLNRSDPGQKLGRDGRFEPNGFREDAVTVQPVTNSVNNRCSFDSLVVPTHGCFWTFYSMKASYWLCWQAFSASMKDWQEDASLEDFIHWAS